MITRDQFYNLMALHQRGDNIFSTLPPEILVEIYQAKPSINSDISKALDLAADAEQAAVDEILRMLDKDPSLLLQAGNVVNRGGNTIIGVTLYEFALGEGDPELAALIAPYFDKIKDKDGNAVDGASERERQYNRYKPHIDAMQTRTPDDLSSLFKIIQDSSAEDVTAALNKEFDRNNELNQALNAFREKHTPRIIRKPCMHYNHKTLEQAFNLLYDQWAALSANDTNYDKCRLVYRQIIGYLQLTLPGIDRMAFARAFKDKNRSLDFIWADGRFPDSFPAGPSSDVGLGFDLLIFGLAAGRARRLFLSLFKIHFEQKLQTYRAYTARPASNDWVRDFVR